MNNIKLSQEQNYALELMLSGANVFLTGEAGTGKSYLLQEFRKRCHSKNVVFLAPTGIAASNIKGQTIHSFFRLKPGLQSPDTYEEVGDSRFYGLLNATRTIVIDEISMVRSDIFWAIDKRLREAAYSNSNSSRPFAGKQLIVCGDFFQLPPIVTNTTERAYLESIGGIRAFEIDLWKKADLHPIMLKDVYRQGNDLLFLDILRNLRHGEPHLSNILIPGTNKPVDSVVALNKLCYQGAKRRNAANEIAICTTRREADSINSDYFSSLESDVEIFRAQISGKFPEKEQPTLVNLELQLGARVMTLANKRNADGSFEYVNGDLGYITGIFNDDDGTGKVMVKLDNGGESLIEPTKWSVYRYEQERDRNTGRTQIKQIECGSFTQIPLRLAWAITIHKSQGMGFDQAAICLGNGCFADGQLYTAISRCRSLNGLKLQRKIFAEDVFCSEAVVDFYKNLERENMI